MSRCLVALLVSVVSVVGCRPAAERDTDISRDASPSGGGATERTETTVATPSANSDAAQETHFCGDKDLRLQPKWGAATGSIGGSWGIINEGPRCSVRLPLSAAVTVGSDTVVGPAAGVRRRGVVELDSGARLSFVFLWSNWCSKAVERFSVDISFVKPDSRLRVVAPGPPPCSGGSESNVSVTNLKLDEGG